MALVDATLQAALLLTFNAMSSMTSGGDEYMAKQTSLAVKAFVLTANVSTTDAGTVAATSIYSGSGTGLPGCFVIDSDALESSLLDVFTQEDVTDDDIADGIADCIDAACSEEDIISTTTTGTLTPPSGTPTTYSGTGKGTFSGTKSIISEQLKTTFTAMKTMTIGGDLLFSQQMASAIGNYLRAGTVSVELDAPIVGSGTGGVS